MSKIPYVLFFYLCYFPFLLSQKYVYKVDLKDVSKDQLTVRLKVPDLKQKTLRFQLPVIIPGTYRVGDYGRFITKFSAKDKNGSNLKVTHPTLNIWEIKNAENIDEISYRVNDTWDTNIISEFAGTNIDIKDSVFVFNNHGIFGFFENYEKLPFKLEIDRPTYLYGGTALNRVGGDKDTDIFEANSYFKLIDNPILFAIPDTATFKVGQTTFLVQVYSETGRNSAESLVPDLKQVVEAQNIYIENKLPLEKYVFLIFMIKEFENYRALWGNGALEHTNSSMYCLHEGSPEVLHYIVRDIAAHEFFHIWTPLSIRSNKIYSFNFMQPEMSKHLWLYEGGTEYASTHYQVKSSIITVERYLDVLSSKIKNSGRYDNSIPFTNISEMCVDKLKNEYGNVYQKGVLINLCLDIKLRALSNGTYGFQNMIHDLSKRYNAENPFDEKDLFDEISEITGYPKEIRAFFRDHVEGSTQLPIGKMMDEVGILFLRKAIKKELSAFGFNPNEALRFNNEEAKLELQKKGIDSFGKNIMGFQQGDLLYKWQGKKIELKTLKDTWDTYEKNAKDGDLLEVVVLRKNEGGFYVPVELSGQLIEVKTEISNGLVLDPAATERELMIRNSWLGSQQ